MKIKKIKIASFRGIVNFEQELLQKTQVVTGPNGTGKSGIIDAFDFLLTGDLQRLRGEGTRDLSLDVHGKHIDRVIKDVYVEADIVDGLNTYSIKRKLQDKKLTLVAGDKSAFEATQEKMSAGQFLLSRRELLKFIACTGQQRSEEIQALLDTSGIEKIRKELAGVVSSFDKKLQTGQSGIETNLKTANTYLGLALDADFSKRREEINIIRKSLEKPEITDWTTYTDIVFDIPTVPASASNSHKKSIYEVLLLDCSPEKNPVPLNQKSESLKNLILADAAKISQTKNFSQLVQGDELVTLGANILQSDNVCPLCDLPWKEKSLAEHLREKKKLTENAKTLKSTYVNNVNAYVLKLKSLSEKIKKLKPALEAFGKSDLVKKVDESVGFVAKRISLLEDISSAQNISEEMSKDEGLIDIPVFSSALSELEVFKNSLPEESKEELAFKKLHQVAALFKSVMQTSSEMKILKKQFTVAKSVNDHFNKARESVFDSLFTEVGNDFVSFYKYLNQDEEKFTAKLVDKEKTIDLKVDFYDRGLHPPHALHSEGHQDSMGICLFLALMKKIKGNGFSFALLDDVMMSIDTGHRKRLCELLKNYFPDTQFIITTHDPVWARQLKEHGVVSKKNLFHFRNWSLESGPVFEAKDVWEILRDKARAGLVHESAAGLRRNLELEFQDICSNLQARVPFKASHSWSLGELKDSATSRMKELLSKAKVAANSWSNNDAMEKIKAVEQELSESIKLSQVDQWQLNPSVHYNEWGNFSKEDIIPLITSLERMVNSFGVNSSKFSLLFKEGVVNPVSIGTLDGMASFTLVEKDE